MPRHDTQSMSYVFYNELDNYYTIAIKRIFQRGFRKEWVDAVVAVESHKWLYDVHVQCW